VGLITRWGPFDFTSVRGAVVTLARGISGLKYGTKPVETNPGAGTSRPSLSTSSGSCHDNLQEVFQRLEIPEVFGAEDPGVHDPQRTLGGREARGDLPAKDQEPR
jgi:hypothetical protein